MSNFPINNHNIRRNIDNYINNRINKLPIKLRGIQIGDWNVSDVTNMNRLFQNRRSFNEPLNLFIDSSAPPTFDINSINLPPKTVNNTIPADIADCQENKAPATFF